MLKSFIEVWKELTLTKLLLGVLAAFSGIVLYWVWEQRQAVFITLTGSPFSLITIAAVVVLVVMAWVAAMFVSMSEQRTALVIGQMADRIKAGEVHSERQDVEITRLHKVIDQAVSDERQACEARIAQLIEVMGSHGIKDRRLNSKFGDLR
ncbi:hypothetical protein RD110_18540 [Rhodoferax koreense]|uniref:Uncharacterized protein n=1 Tax=Rhodoferax koreensis TaxID=1842727 RepID=A0A1P8JYY6_9BURK|nr:hypothetical protein [Rhodoferax koreense]APW38955.1 hypothetical protein RD110_18540 [Rhodoferax koreense]